MAYCMNPHHPLFSKHLLYMGEGRGVFRSSSAGVSGKGVPGRAGSLLGKALSAQGQRSSECEGGQDKRQGNTCLT